MSLFDKASLMLTPSGVKTDKIHSQKPSNGNGDFTFDRNLNTATRVNKDGYIETVAADVPRLNYPFIDGVVQDSPSLILEPARTNSVFHSQEVDNAYWLKSNCTITANTSISPDGTLNADTFTTSATSDSVLYKGGITCGSLSFFAKDIDLSIGKFKISVDNVGSASWNKDGTLNSFSGGTATNGVDYGNGWFRFVFNVTSGSFVNYGIAGGIVGENILVFGLQNEPSATYPTSYIPTSGSTVTRSAETANGAGTAAEFNDSEGVLFAEIAALPETGRIALNDGTTSNNVRFVYNSGINRIDAILYNGSNQAVLSYVLPIEGSFNKIAFKYKASDFSLYVDGFEVNSRTNGGTTFSVGTLSELDFDDGGGNTNFYGKTKQVAVFKTALTDSELEALTSWTSFNEMATGQEYSIQ